MGRFANDLLVRLHGNGTVVTYLGRKKRETTLKTPPGNALFP